MECNKSIMKFSSKAKNLQNLKPILTSAKILPLNIFKKNELLKNLDQISAKLTSENLIIRSSSILEDSSISSCAGKFETIQHVNKQNFKSSILKVAKKLCDDDEIFIQPMLENISFFAVCMSSINGANYISINYDKSGDSKNLTAGDGLFETRIILKGHKSGIFEFDKIMELISELETIFDTDEIDLEVAFSNLELYLFQVRPIVKNESIKIKDLTLIHEMIAKKFQKLSIRRPNLLGEKTIFGIMPDWNPAEILGLRPTRLAISLYKELITDNIWAYGRDNYGYKNLRSFPLMIDFAGLCYIDTRVSFNSFLPKSLNDEICEKLVNHWLHMLEKNPHNHDKIEFEIVLSAYEFDIDFKLNKLIHFNSSEKQEIKSALKNITLNLFDLDSRFYEDLNRINKLNERFYLLENSNLSSIDKIYWLIEECKRYGTLSFAGIARVAFIATSLLDSLVRVGGITQLEKEEFLSSLDTISSSITRDFNLLSKDEFLKIYGHLRLNTYDITSPRYDENFEKYFSDTKFSICKKSIFYPKNPQLIEKILKENGFNISVKEFFDFIKLAIQSRESSKFSFTKVLSKALNEIKIYTQKLKIDEKDAAFIDIKLILGFYTTLDSLSAKELILDNIAKNKAEFEITKLLNLPPLICKKEDIFSFVLSSNEPNFITQKYIKAKLATIDDKDLSGKIVIIKSADPGYDFIFSKNIGGLITAYGGINSHMAVRCAEFGLPAAIGVGESKFNEYARFEYLELDCLNKRIRI